MRSQKAKRKIAFAFSLLIYLCEVRKKKAKIACLIESHRGKALDPHYLGYFECFNRGLFFESHDVLEELWLAARRGPNDAFYKGLIQFAGAFVHLQKNRLRPAGALLKLARANMQKYPAVHEHLNLTHLLDVIADWLCVLETREFSSNPLAERDLPQINLIRQ